MIILIYKLDQHKNWPWYALLQKSFQAKIVFNNFKPVLDLRTHDDVHFFNLNCHVTDEISCYVFILRVVFITEIFIHVKSNFLRKFMIFFPGLFKNIYTRGL